MGRAYELQVYELQVYELWCGGVVVAVLRCCGVAVVSLLDCRLSCHIETSDHLTDSHSLGICALLCSPYLIYGVILVPFVITMPCECDMNNLSSRIVSLRLKPRFRVRKPKSAPG